MKVAVLGLGDVGTVTAACLATNGHDVWGVDVDAAKVDDIRADANRRHVESKLPHLERLLAHEPSEALRGADIAIVTSSDPLMLDALVTDPPRHLIDLNGRLGSEVEALPGYEGLSW
jgi:UDP-glucose 6-dehydrogenase